jgi:hypothetical protein
MGIPLSVQSSWRWRRMIWRQRDLFGGPVREAKSPIELVHLLGQVGVYDVHFMPV